VDEANIAWEYMTLTQSTQAIQDLDVRLTALGSIGWEAVGYMSVDRTVGLNAVSVLLKRRCPTFPAHTVRSPEWAPDPAGRFAQRFWDGMRWSQHVIAASGEQSVDWPNSR
jgi:hypothetical protein